jgi:hypothetical protein
MTSILSHFFPIHFPLLAQRNKPSTKKKKEREKNGPISLFSRSSPIEA